MKESVIKQVLALQSKSTAELKALWRSIFDTQSLRMKNGVDS
jgi:hypothetical protein